MSETAKKIEIQEQIDKEVVARSKALLTKKGFNFDGYTDRQVVDTAKLVCNVQEELNIERQQENAKKLESILKKETVKPFTDMAESIFELVKSEIGPNPTKSYGATINLDNGDNILIGITAYQEVDEKVKKQKTAKQEIGNQLVKLVESHGVSGLRKMLTVKRGTKERFTFGVYPKKVKVNDLEFQLTLGYEVKKEEE